MKHMQNHQTSITQLLSGPRSLPTVHSCHRSRPRSRTAQMIAAAALAIAGAAPVKAQSILHVLNNSDNDSPGSLRFEIEQANMLAGPVRIDFASPFTLNLTANLPPLTNPAGVTINGNNS